MQQMFIFRGGEFSPKLERLVYNNTLARIFFYKIKHFFLHLDF